MDWENASRKTGLPVSLLVKETKLMEFLGRFDAACRQQRQEWALFGGTAINKFYLKDSARFSEDADFHLFNSSPAKALALLRQAGANSVEGPARIFGEFYRFKLHYSSDEAGRPDSVSFDANLRLKKPLSKIVFSLPSTFLAAFGYPNTYSSLPTYPVETLAAMKLLAIAGRTEGRDFYDFHQLLMHHSPTRAAVLGEAFKYRHDLFDFQPFRGDLIEAAAERVSTVDEKKLAQIDPFLLSGQKPDWRILKKDLKRLLLTKLGK